MKQRKPLEEELRERDKANGQAEGNGRPADDHVDFQGRTRPPDPPEQGPPLREIGDEPADGEEELGILLSTVQPERVDWLWPARIPLGKLTIIDGDPGLGKSVLTLDLAARVSRGMEMPDGSPGRLGGVVLLSAEDGLADTIRPRLDAAGADCGRILALDSVLAEGGQGKERRPPVLPLDVAYLATAVRRMAALLVVVDPLTAFLGAETNTHRDADCRRALFPLARLAEETGAGVVVVRHLNKGEATNPLYRGGGSIAIIGAARSGLLVARDPDNPDRRILAGIKCNLAKLPPSIAFDLSTAANGSLRVGWLGESAHTAESLLAVPKDEARKGGQRPEPDEGQGRPKVKGYADKKATETKAAELERRGIAAGLVDPLDQHAKKPLAEHAEDYRRYLTAKGDTAEYVAKMLFRLTAVLDGCRFVTIGDLQSSAKRQSSLCRWTWPMPWPATCGTRPPALWSGRASGARGPSW